jgi:hypothetical protein
VHFWSPDITTDFLLPEQAGVSLDEQQGNWPLYQTNVGACLLAGASRRAVSRVAPCRMSHRVTCLRHECVTSGSRFVIMPLRRWDHRKWWHSLQRHHKTRCLCGYRARAFPALTFRWLPKQSTIPLLVLIGMALWSPVMFRQVRRRTLHEAQCESVLNVTCCRFRCLACFKLYYIKRLCGLVVSFWLITQRSWVWFPALPDFPGSSGSGMGSTQPLRE